jgi:hypothetical protein
MPGVVWVLGAGFSQSLGGPQLPSLLSWRSEERIRAAFPNTPRVTEGWDIGIIREMLKTHGWEQEEKQPAWADAEELLEHLDNAAFAPSGRLEAQRLVRMRATKEIPSDAHFEMLAAAAKRIVAAECCLFLRNADTSSERWRPYVGWARSLDPADTIITFNYDRVVEMAAQAAKRQLDIVAGNQQPREGSSRLLKMHGSVDWRCQKQEYVLVDDPEHAVKCAPDEIGIASPGPSKLTLSEQWKGLWQGAERALREADAIVFAGYRFPPTDSFSRERLLGAVMQNVGPHHVAVHTVLGPETDGQHARRLRGMLLYALGRAKRSPFPGGRLPQSSPPKFYTFQSQPLYAEDFLSLMQRSTIIDPHQGWTEPA